MGPDGWSRPHALRMGSRRGAAVQPTASSALSGPAPPRPRRSRWAPRPGLRGSVEERRRGSVVAGGCGGRRSRDVGHRVGRAAPWVPGQIVRGRDRPPGRRLEKRALQAWMWVLLTNAGARAGVGPPTGLRESNPSRAPIRRPVAASTLTPLLPPAPQDAVGPLGPRRTPTDDLFETGDVPGGDCPAGHQPLRLKTSGPMKAFSHPHSCR